ncbi:hypothetical protein GCM10027348_19140 [Hymenobacter tenuis]
MRYMFRKGAAGSAGREVEMQNTTGKAKLKHRQAQAEQIRRVDRQYTRPPLEAPALNASAALAPSSGAGAARY